MYKNLLFAQVILRVKSPYHVDSLNQLADDWKYTSIPVVRKWMHFGVLQVYLDWTRPVLSPTSSPISVVLPIHLAGFCSPRFYKPDLFLLKALLNPPHYQQQKMSPLFCKHICLHRYHHQCKCMFLRIQYQYSTI